MGADTELRRLDVVEKELIEEILTAQTLPKTTNADNDKVLTVKSGKWTKAALPSELPAVTAEDDGKVLMVVDGEWAVVDLNDLEEG